MNSNKQAGYSLLSSFALIIILSILGISLVTVTTNGIIQNEIRQNKTRSIDQAEKGLDYAIADIYFLLNDMIEKKGGSISKGDLVDTLNKLINERSCKKEVIEWKKNTSHGEYRVCILSTKSGEENLSKRTLTFKSIGISGNSRKQESVLESSVELGADTAPEQLNYAVSTNNGGNLTLHGRVDLFGDLKVDGDLFITNRAVDILNGKYSLIPSTYPMISPLNGSGSSKIFIKEQRKIYSLACPLLSECSEYKTVEKGKFSTLFPSNFPKPKIEKGKEMLDQIDIVGKIADIKREIDQGNSQYQSLDGLPKSNYDATQNNKLGIYVKNDVDWILKNRTLKGNFYINGDLSLTGIKLTANDAMIFVNGDVDINASSIVGERNGGSRTNGKLIIFATGDIDIKFSTDLSSNAIEGFFYSKKAINLYGIISKYTVKGGLSANTITLSAVKQVFYNKSRLQIIYDSEIPKAYELLNREEEKIKVLSEPIIKDKSLKMVGNT